MVFCVPASEQVELDIGVLLDVDKHWDMDPPPVVIMQQQAEEAVQKMSEWMETAFKFKCDLRQGVLLETGQDH